MAYNMNSPIIQQMAKQGVLYGQPGCPIGQPAAFSSAGMKGPEFVDGPPPTIQTVYEPVYAGQGLGQQPAYITPPQPVYPQTPVTMPQAPLPNYTARVPASDMQAQYNLYGSQIQQPVYGYNTQYSVPIAQAGYNGNPTFAQQNPYYNQTQYSGYGYYGQQAYMNPYLYRDMYAKAQEIAQQRANLEMTLSINLSRCAHDYFNDEITDDQIDFIYNPQRQMQMIQNAPVPKVRQEFIETQQNIMLLQQLTCPIPSPQMLQQIAIDYASVALPVMDCNKYVDPNCGMIEFFKQAGNLLREIKIANSKKSEHNLSKLYDHQSYQEQLFMKFPAFAREIDHLNLSSDFREQLAKSMIEGKDALYITLPEHMKSNYMQRKIAFKNAMMTRSD